MIARAAMTLALLAACRKHDVDRDGVVDKEDCAPTDALAFPGAEEVCDGVDNDCNGAVDDVTPALVWYADADGDGYGDAQARSTACLSPPGASANGDDCDDDDPAVHPGAYEGCDGVDRDCDGAAADAATYYADADGDGHAGARLRIEACAPPPGWQGTADDCDDLDAAAFPGAAEACNGRDDDCDGAVPAAEADADGDAFLACVDCDDTRNTVFPGGTELCNDADDDCDGTADDTPADGVLWYADIDQDGFGDGTNRQIACDQPAGHLAYGGDCNDADPTYRPGAKIACDGTDRDCDGAVDNDLDGDRLADAICGGDDCDDEDPWLPDDAGRCWYRDCEDARTVGHATSRTYAVDPDGDGGAQPFSAYCDMATDGGGWTLVYAYAFTDAGAFTGNGNAVTPRPSWSAPMATVPVSTTPPQGEADYNAIAFSLWDDVGTEFLVKSNLAHWLVCTPGTGSLVAQTPGTVSCRNVANVGTTCADNAPNQLAAGPIGTGPALSNTGLFYHWDGSTTAGWPTHDPCGTAGPNQLGGVQQPQGAIYVK